MAEATEAQKRAHKNYIRKFSRVEIRVSPDFRSKIQLHADEYGESVNAFITRAVEEAIKRDKEKPEA